MSLRFGPWLNNQNFNPVFGNRNNRIMTLKSAFEDVLETTLAAVSGIIGKLEYIAGLRDGNKKYMHWGLQRLHGEEASQQALAEAHRLLFLNILRAPLRMLKDDLKQSSDAQQAAPHEYAESLRMRQQNILPQDLGGGSVRHFNSVLRALSSLASNRAKTRPDANRPA
jgi:hypothetical protein